MGAQGVSGRPSWKLAKIGQNRPFSAFLALFRRVRRAPGKSRKRRKKAFFLRYPQICSNPHLLNPHLRHSNGGRAKKDTVEPPNKFRNEYSAQSASFRPDVPADIRPKTSVRLSQSWTNKQFGTDMPHGRPRKIAV